MLAWVVAPLGTESPLSRQSAPKRMSFHNRILLNRAAVAQLHTLEVMLAVSPQGLETTAALVARLGGHVRYADARMGYLRVDVPIERMVELVDTPLVDAYQISSLSAGSWFRDSAPQLNADMFRRYERDLPAAAPGPRAPLSLPVLSSQEARQAGYTGGDDAGVETWLRTHPTFDGRGVTMALLEDAQPEFLHPTIGYAKTLDGRDLPKLAGILNTLDPSEPDATRVDLDTTIHAAHAWSRVGDRTYAVPRPGTYWFGIFALPAGGNLVHEYGVLQDSTSRITWVDTNGDRDFRDERPVPDINDRFEPQVLKLTYPRRVDMAFVVGQGRTPRTVHVYASLNSHMAMTLSVAAGSHTADGLARGVAPGARVLLVRAYTSSPRGLRNYIEACLEVIKRPDVDLLSDSNGIDMAPDTAGDFVGLLFSRMVAAYDKPIFHGAGNSQLALNSVSALGGSFSVGGSIGPDTFAAFFGGTRLTKLAIHPVSAAGPAIDGQLKPDFIAPVHVVAADLLTQAATPPHPQERRCQAPAQRLSSQLLHIVEQPIRRGRRRIAHQRGQTVARVLLERLLQPRLAGGRTFPAGLGPARAGKWRARRQRRVA